MCQNDKISPEQSTGRIIDKWEKIGIIGGWTTRHL